jgi:short-subunit dehydrogenase
MLGARAVMRPRMDWDGRLVLITGGSRGLGLVLARKLLERGARVAICARDVDELERARQDLERCGGAVFTFVCDVTREDEVRGMVAELTRMAGPVDVLINNAGAITMGPVHEMTREDFEEALNLYYWAPLHATLAVLPDMQRRRFGQIVNISSIGGKVPVPHLTPYCAGKFALTGLSECLRLELAKDGVGVTTACPFVMRTGSQVNAVFKGRNKAEFAWFMLAGSSPPVSIAVERAAERIILAAERNEAEVLVGLEAQAAAKVYGVCPSLMLGVMSVVDRLLPRRGGIGSERRRGLESRTAAATAFPTKAVYRAALEHNQVWGERREVVEGIVGGRDRKPVAGNL